MSAVKQSVFGIIGVGGIAQSQHLPNLTRAPHVRLKTACDLREDVLQEMQRKYDVPHAESDHEKLLADPEIEAVVVATREDMQAKLAIEALDAGKHVYVEKPLAETPEQIAAVVDAEKRSGKHACVGFNRRMAPAYRKAKEVIDSDGGAKNIHYRIADEYWRWGKRNPPGVRVIHEVCHIFDILRWFTNSDPVSVYCVDSRPDDEIFTLKFESGCVASIMNSAFVTMDLPKERIELVSELGAVTVEEFVECRTHGYANFDNIYRFVGHSHPDQDLTHKYLLEKDGANALYALRRMGWETRERHAKDGGAGDLDGAELDLFVSKRCPHWNYMVDKGWLTAVDHFAQCIQSGERPKLATAEDGWWSSALSSAAIKSRESGEVVKVRGPGG